MATGKATNFTHVDQILSDCTAGKNGHDCWQMAILKSCYKFLIILKLKILVSYPKPLKLCF